ncbi:MAG TPA: hypothetical protein VFY91_10100 [Microbacterium sp.]|nr:hypothetical protein [Microbacterium sp.]
MTRHPDRRPGAVVAAALALSLALVLAGCTGDSPAEPVPSSTSAGPGSAGPDASPSSAAPGDEPSAAPPVALLPDGSAAENLPYFAGLTNQVWSSESRGEGRAYIDALVAGGFDKAAMQVTRDESTVGNPAESIQFSVLWKGECLIGQVGPATGDPVAVVARPLEGGGCLVGNTRPIDW